MSRRTLEVDVISRAGAVVRGHGSRTLLEEMVGRPPVWLSRCRGWSLQTHRVPDLLALCELHNYDVTVTGPRAVANTITLATAETVNTDTSIDTAAAPDMAQDPLW